MGCCSSVKRSEEEKINEFFKKLMKDNNFVFDIKNYKDNYDKISNKSGNNFKKLSRKQNVRVEFIKIIKKEGNNSINHINNIDEVNNILYRIIILTILLENKIKEENSKTDNNQNDKRNLLNLKIDILLQGYDFLNLQIDNLKTYKVIIYYLAKMFYLCFKELEDSSNNININIFINKIQLIIDNNCLDDEEESYIFIKDNLLSLSEFFHYNKNYILSEEQIINNLINLYSILLYHHYDYFYNNFSLIKENINKNMQNANKLMNLDLNDQNVLPNLKIIFEAINLTIINNDINTDINNDIKDINDIGMIIESIYYVLKISFQDINSGKNILNFLGIKLKEKNKDNNDNKFNDIILLILFYECCVNEDKKITLCLLEYLGEFFFDNNSSDKRNFNNIYYDILMDSYYLIYQDQALNKQYILLISQIFIKEIENKENSFFINQLIQTYYKKEKMANILIKMFFYFLIDISQYYQEKNSQIINNNDLVKKNNDIILKILNQIIKENFINTNGFSPLNHDNNYINSSTNSNTNKIYINGDNFNHPKLLINDYEIITNNFFDFNNLQKEILSNIEFYLCFHLFIIKYLDIKDLIYDLSKREAIHSNLFKIITKLEIMLIQSLSQENNNISSEQDNDNKNLYIKSILMAVQISLTVVEINNKDNIQDCYILFKSLEKNVQNLLGNNKKNKKGNKEIDYFNIKIIYSNTWFIISQFARLISIPYPFDKIHQEILDSINKIDENCGKYLTNIDINNFILYKKSKEPNFQYLKEILLEKEKKASYIEYSSFNKILDIIYSKLFEKKSSLHIFFDNQASNLNSKNLDKSVSKVSDNITEIQDVSLINHYTNNCNENYIDDISIHIIPQKNDLNNNDNSFINPNKKINLPSLNDNNIATDERMLSNSFTNDENPFQSIKI